MLIDRRCYIVSARSQQFSIVGILHCLFFHAYLKSSKEILQIAKAFMNFEPILHFDPN